MKRLTTLGLALVAALALAATLALTAYGGGKGRGNASTSSAAHSTAGPHTTIATRQLPGVGTVLVDHTGKALYHNNLETTRKIVCDGACNAFWKPLTLTGGKPTAPAGVGTLGVIKRPDGSSQVIDNAKPLYTFVDDSPGRANGNGFVDDFNGHQFTWTIAHAGRTTASAAASATKTTTSNTSSYPTGYGY